MIPVPLLLPPPVPVPVQTVASVPPLSAQVTPDTKFKVGSLGDRGSRVAHRRVSLRQLRAVRTIRTGIIHAPAVCEVERLALSESGTRGLDQRIEATWMPDPMSTAASTSDASSTSEIQIRFRQRNPRVSRICAGGKEKES